MITILVEHHVRAKTYMWLIQKITKITLDLSPKAERDNMYVFSFLKKITNIVDFNYRIFYTSVLCTYQFPINLIFGALL